MRVVHASEFRFLWRPEESVNLLELVVMSYLTGVLGTELWFSARVVHALNH